jgi:hypothetical protein
MEPESSLPHSQVPATCPYPEPTPSSPHNPARFLKIHLNILHPATSGSLQWSLSLGFPHKNPVHTSPLPHTRHMSRPSHSSRFYHPHNIVRRIKQRSFPKTALTNWISFTEKSVYCAVRNESLNIIQIWRNGIIGVLILNVDARWKWIASFKPRPLYPPATNSQYPLYGGLQSWSERCQEEKKSYLCQASNRDYQVVLLLQTNHYTDWAIPAYGLVWKWQKKFRLFTFCQKC